MAKNGNGIGGGGVVVVEVVIVIVVVVLHQVVSCWKPWSREMLHSIVQRSA
jgi:hypothetical protein